MTIASPCIRQCTLDAQRICQGCHRMLDEIAAWSFASDHEKLAMLAAVRRRAGGAGAAMHSAHDQHHVTPRPEADGIDHLNKP